MSIESLDLNKAISYLGADDNEQSWSQFDEYHRAALQRLEARGARIEAKEGLVLGTALTMSSARFRAVFAEHGVETACPQDEEARASIIGLIAELQLGKPEGGVEATREDCENLVRAAV
jgi:aspartate/glutamate racemase